MSTARLSSTRLAGCAGLLGLAMAPGALTAMPVAAANSAMLHAPLVRTAGARSSNWSGYVSTKGPFSSVSASWTQPSASCTSQTTYSSFWIGIDGDGSNSVEQTGSEVDCSRSTPIYYGWYEMYPAYPVNYTNTVRPGDAFSANITVSGSSYTLSITDKTEGWTKTQHKTSASAKKHSAEIIAEAPSSQSGVLPLANFGTMQFSAATANGQAIGALSPTAITMASGKTVKAAPSALTSQQDFSVTWHHS